jgi:transposase
MMIKINGHDADLAALPYGRFHHPDPRVPVRLEALYVRGQGVANRDLPRLCGISKARCHRSRTAYATGGSERLQHFAPRRPRRRLPQHRPPLAADVQPRPPATVAEAAARIAALSGMTRQPTQVRQCLNALGRKPRKAGLLPATAHVEAHEAVKKPVGSRGSPTPTRAAAPSCAGMPPLSSWRPVWASSGAGHAWLSQRPQAANG